ncbi:MAG: ParA family protein [Candidatus Hinthialibacter antarcticus]|nr:ParA family protein [Candidatus Hinthialibacter antarcticus]
MAKVICVINQKGGVGKTTSAVNLAACLAAKGHETLLLDIDPQGNASSGLGINRAELEKTIFDVMIDEAPMQSILKPTKQPKLRIAPANSDLLSAELHLAGDPDGKRCLSRAVVKFFNETPPALQPKYIIVDCPPSLGQLSINAILTSDTVIIPVQCEYYALEGLTDILTTTTMLRQNFNTGLSLEGILLTMADRRLNLSHQVEEEIRNVYRDFVFQSVIYRSVRLSEAPSHGTPIIQYDPQSIGSKAYMALAEEVIENETKSPRPWPLRASV